MTGSPETRRRMTSASPIGRICRSRPSKCTGTGNKRATALQTNEYYIHRTRSTNQIHSTLIEYGMAAYIQSYFLENFYWNPSNYLEFDKLHLELKMTA